LAYSWAIAKRGVTNLMNRRSMWSRIRRRRPSCRETAGLVLATLCFAGLASSSQAGAPFEEEPINYLTAPVDDPVARVQSRLDRGEEPLRFDEAHGYLQAVLDRLNVSPKSQVLVFSKTSFQFQRITPRTPRAVYFNDDVYVGWVQGGEVVEVSSVDPQLGAVFYSLPQRETASPTFRRHTHECLQCHASSLTQGIPGHVVRSVYPAADGMPVFSQGTYVTDHTSPFDERWGGWYVTGTHGAQRHMGNVVVQERDEDDSVRLDADAGANVTDLSDRFDTSPYLTPHSDLVALMTLEHQSQMHNLIAHASIEARIALEREEAINRAMERPDGYRSPTTERQFESLGNKLLAYMLFAEEAPLTAAVSGTSGFAEEFSARGPRDRRGRSLRDFDLERRLLRYPCSYLIYSEAFDRLPAPVREHVYQRLWDVLLGRDESKTFDHLTADDRQAIREILVDTKPGLPEYWLAEP